MPEGCAPWPTYAKLNAVPPKAPHRRPATLHSAGYSSKRNQSRTASHFWRWKDLALEMMHDCGWAVGARAGNVFAEATRTSVHAHADGALNC
jgi:hypothetical protein